MGPPIITTDDATPSEEEQSVVWKSQNDLSALLSFNASNESSISVLRLCITSMQAQLSEQLHLYEDHVRASEEDRRLREEEEGLRAARDSARVEELLGKGQRLQNLVRETTREVLERKRQYQSYERRIKEERAVLLEESKRLKTELSGQKEKLSTLQKTIEQKVKRKQEMLIHDLKTQLAKQERANEALQVKHDQLEGTYSKKLDILTRKVASSHANYKALKKRRDHEMEGFTNDIMLLRKQVQVLEHHLLQYGPLKDRELLLLQLARDTGKKASKIGNELHTIKAKLYRAEEEARGLTF